MGKREIEIRVLEPVGSYAVQPTFSDSHATGIYSWEYLYHLGENQDRLWAEYLEKLNKAGAGRGWIPISASSAFRKRKRRSASEKSSTASRIAMTS